MNIKSQPRSAVKRGLGAFLVAATLSLSLPAAPLAALDAYEYFTISYDVAFSSSNIAEGQSFSVTVTGQAVCIQEPPLEPTEAIITGRIIARHQGSGATVILNPQYTAIINPFPNHIGESGQSTQFLSLQFPAGSQPGEYDVIGELLEAKLRTRYLIYHITEYLPPTELMGSVSYDMPPVEPPPSTPPETPEEPEEPSVTPESPAGAPENPPENPPDILQTPQQPPDSSISPAFFTISDLVPPPAEIGRGDSLTLNAKVSNTGGQPGEYEVTLRLNGTSVETKNLTLESNTSQTVSFSLANLAPGQYSFSLNGLTGFFAVAEPAASPPEAQQAETPEATQEADEDGFPTGTIIYIFDALLAGIIVWLVLKRRRAA